MCAIDSDTLVEPDALQRMVRPFLVDDDVRRRRRHDPRRQRLRGPRRPRRPASARRAGRSPALQAVEYLRAFLSGRLGWNRLGGNLIISGAFGLFRREPMIAAGGYLHETVGEDMEVVVRMRRRAREHEAAATASCSCPTRWPGPRCRRGCGSSPASATAGTAASPTCCAATCG